MIKPTNGRVVLFTPGTDTPEYLQLDPKQPLTAHIVHVWDDRTVNLVVFDSTGVLRNPDCVTLLQDDDAAPEGECFCEWMPYQKGQAAKTEEAEAKLKYEDAKNGVRCDNGGCVYSRAIEQSWPRECLKCRQPEPRAARLG